MDALRYSFLIPGGTARFLGTAGAFNAVGADLSTMNTNPAGLGIFKTSEFVFTSSVFSSATTSSYYSQDRSENNTHFSIPNLGFVYSIPLAKSSESGGFQFLQLGFGLVRNADFHNHLAISGTNPESSLLDAYVEWSNGYTSDELNEFDTKLAYETYLIDPVQGTLNYTNKAPLYPNGTIAPVDQRKFIESEGYVNEMDLSVSVNYGDWIYVGITCGLPYIRYYEVSTYQEFNNITDDTTTFDTFSKYNYLDTRGNGFNFKFGLIVRPANFLRLGAAIHTPTYYNNMRDDYNTSMASILNNGKSYNDYSPYGTYDYQLETPLRAIASAAIIFKHSGLLSFDYEYVDYASAELKGYSGFDFYDENESIRSLYTFASNFRAGTEWKFGNFAARGGYGYYGNPYKSNVNDGTRQLIAAGIGYRTDYFFVDFAYNHIFFSEDYYLYSTEDVYVPPATINTKQNSYTLTIGIKY
jgi:hypothetical protein